MALDERRRHRAGAHGLPVEMHRAGAAGGDAAAGFGADETEIFAQDPQKRRVEADLDGLALATLSPCPGTFRLRAPHQDGFAVIRRLVSPPCDMPIGTNQHQLPVIEREKVRMVSA